MDAIALKLCDIQGRLFELSARKGYDSAAFVKAFMRSQTAKALDSTYNRMQWAGEEYLLEEVASEAALSTKGEVFSLDVLYWMGYLYRYWHYYTGRVAPKFTGRHRSNHETKLSDVPHHGPCARH